MEKFNEFDEIRDGDVVLVHWIGERILKGVVIYSPGSTNEEWVIRTEEYGLCHIKNYDMISLVKRPNPTN